MHIDPSAALGPDSLAWKYAGDNLQFFLAGTVLTLQVAHPVVGAGVGEHSVYKADPWGRLERTTRFGIRLLYGGPEEAERASRELLALHAKIKGTDAKGRTYFALDREAYAWVHLTSYYAMVKSQEYFGTPLSPTQKKQLYAEWRLHGRVLGIRDADMPSDVPAFEDYFENMIRSRLEHNPVVEDLLTPGQYVPKPPPLHRLPDTLWKAFYRSADHFAKLSTKATLPPSLRRKLGIRMRPLERAQFEGMRAVTQATHAYIPPKLRYLPVAYRAMKGAERPYVPSRNAH